MKKLVLFALLSCLANFICAQHIGALRDTSLKRINAEIEKELPAFMVRLEKDNDERTDKFYESIAFGTDTFKIESFTRKCIAVYHSTEGINNAYFYAFGQYNHLLNKYDKLLSAKLKPADRTTLAAAQKSWFAFRDNELKLQRILKKDRYSGGGMQSNITAYQNVVLVKQRVLQLFHYYAALY